MYWLTPYPIIPIGNFIGVVLSLLPLLSNIRKLSLAVWGYAFWISTYNFITFVDTIIWHNNVDIVASVWCDITAKLQDVGAGFGIRACTLVISTHLYRITRLQGPIESSNSQKRKTMIYELSLIIGLPVVMMALFIIVQPDRFDIVEELGCTHDVYSFVGYIIQYVPQFTANVACAILAPLTLRTFLRHRKEMHEFLSNSRDMTRNKYYRLMVIACLDTAFNLPVLILIIILNIASGKENGLNYPYVSWKNVHDGEGGNSPGVSLSSILQTPASEWSTDKWGVLLVKWNEWVFVVHAVMFFGVFGTTPEMRSYYRAAFWFIPKRLGFKKQRVSETETVSDVGFSSNPGQQAGGRPAANRRRGSLSFLETTITSAASVTRSAGVPDVETNGSDEESIHLGIETMGIVEEVKAGELEEK